MKFNKKIMVDADSKESAFSKVRKMKIDREYGVPRLIPAVPVSARKGRKKGKWEVTYHRDKRFSI